MVGCYSFNSRFSDPSSHPTTIIVFACIYITIFVFSLCGNTLVIVVTVRHHSLQSVQNIFILNLAASNIILNLVSIPVTPVTLIQKEWYFGIFMCRLVGGVSALGMFISAFNLCAIAIDRYFRLVLSPGRSLINRTHAIYITWCLWIFSTICTLPYILALNLKTLENYQICGEFCTEIWPNETSKRIYTIFVLVTQAFIPFTIITICYHAIFNFLSKRALSRLTSIGKQSNMLDLLTATVGRTHHHSEQLFHLNNQRHRIIIQRKRVTIILISMVLVFGLTTLPHNVVSLMTELDSDDENGSLLALNGTDLTYLLNLLTHCIASLGCIANPLLYGFLNPKFREVIFSAIKSTHSLHSRQSYHQPQISKM